MQNVMVAAGSKERNTPKEEKKSSEKERFFVDFSFATDPKNWGMYASIALAVAGTYYLTRSAGKPRQISWQEFRTRYLERGEVDRLEVVNRSIVRVYLRRDSAAGVSHVLSLLVQICGHEDPDRTGGLISVFFLSLAGPCLPHIQHWQCGLI